MLASSHADLAEVVSPSDAPAVAPPARIELTARAFPLGTKIESTSRLGIEVLLTTDGPNGRPFTVEDYGVVSDHRTVEILGFRAHALRKIRVTFQDRSTTHIINGRQRRNVSPVSGRTYVLEARDQGLAILDDEEHDVTHGEGVVLSQLFRTLGAPDEMARAIPQAPMAQGQAVPGLADALERDLEHGLEGRVWFGKVSVTPTGIRQAGGTDCVVLGIVLQVGFETEGRSVQMDTKGEMLLRSDNAWPVALDLAGPVSVDFTEKGVPIHGQGKSRLTGVYAYP
jgi:hypothetical protein